jgi:DNA polymerase-1
MSSLLLIDGHALAYRAFYAFPPQLTWEGKPVNALFGFMTLLTGAIDQIKPAALCVCFDRKEPTFRHTSYPEYKAHRPAAPEDFSHQMPLLYQALREMQIPIIDALGYEADDVLGTLSRMASERQMDCVILTGDRDTYQLIDDHVRILMPQKGAPAPVLIDEAWITAKYELTPTQLIELKALQGDTSDNIPGVPGIGEKTALKLMHSHGSLAAIYDNLASLTPPSLQKKLADGKDLAYVSLDLARIRRDAPISTPFDALGFAPDFTLWTAVFEKFGFTRLLKKYADVTIPADKSSEQKTAETAPETTKASGHYQLINTIEALKAVIPKLQNGFAIDVETSTLSPFDAALLGIAISPHPGEAFYIAIEQTGDNQLPLFATAPTDLPPNPFLELLKPLLENAKIPKTTHHGKYEWLVFKQLGIQLEGIQNDSLLAAYLLYPMEKMNLKALVHTHLHVQMTTFEELSGKNKTLAHLSPEEVLHYAAADADYTGQLSHFLESRLKALDLETLYRTVEIPIQTILAEMENNGVKINKAHLESLEKNFNHQVQEAEKTIFELAGHPFNVGSPKQLATVLFEELGLPSAKKTKTGHSTDVDVLEGLAKLHPIAPALLRYRKLEKLLNTYIRTLPKLIHSKSGLIHTSFNQTGTATGRFSSTNPNLQNIPIRDPEGLAIRGAFVSRFSGGKIVSADYSQIELRVMAHLSEDPSMLAAFHAGADIHIATAAIVFDIPEDQVTKEQRYQAKAVNFGLIYGISSFGLSQNLGISRSDAKTLIDNYFAQFPGVKQFMNDSIASATERGYVTTMLGRIRPIPELQNGGAQRQFGERIAINTRVQGSAADLMKMAMIRVDAALKAKKAKSLLCIQVHDELVLDVHPDELTWIPDLLTREMAAAATLRVPLKSDVAIGENWAEVSG